MRQLIGFEEELDRVRVRKARGGHAEGKRRPALETSLRFSLVRVHLSLQIRLSVQRHTMMNNPKLNEQLNDMPFQDTESIFYPRSTLVI